MQLADHETQAGVGRTVGPTGFEPRHPVWAGVRLAGSAGLEWTGFRWNQADSGLWEVWLIGLGLVHRDDHRYHLVTVLVACGRREHRHVANNLERIR